MHRATAISRCFSLLSTTFPSVRHSLPFPSLSSPPPLPRRFRFYAPNSAEASSPPPSWKKSWKHWEKVYAITNNSTYSNTPAIAQLWLVWHKWYKLLTSYPFPLYSGRVFRDSDSPEFALDLQDLECKSDLGFHDFVYRGDAMDVSALIYTSNACLAFARHHPNLIWSLSRNDIEVVVENGSPFLFIDAPHTIRRMKLFVDGTTPDALGCEKPSMVDLMKFLLSYASAPLFSPVVNSAFCAERVHFNNREILEESVGRLFGEIAKIVVPQKVSSS